MKNFEEFTKELKSYSYDSIEDAAAAIYEDEDFDPQEAMLFIVHYGHDDEISKDVYEELSIIAKPYLETLIKNILDENDGSDIFGYDEDDDTYSVDD